MRKQLIGAATTCLFSLDAVGSAQPASAQKGL